MTEDSAQLRLFIEKGDEEAFREVVSRHFDLVHGTALRLTNQDASMAEDVAQSVFTDLARKAGWFPRDIKLAGWLHKATRFAAANAVRGEQRRRLREKEAFSMMDTTPESPPEWERLRPMLDAAISKLSSKDRDAVLLHYFERKSFLLVGAALGISGATAQKRVSRALAKLRAILARGGLEVSAASLCGFLGAGIISPSPDGLALSVAKASLAKAAAIGPQGVVGVLTQHLTWTQTGATVAGLLVLLLGGGAAFWVHAAHPTATSNFVAVDLSPFSNGGLDKSWTTAYGDNHLAELGRGRRLLKGVPFEIQGVVQLQGAEWKKRGYQFPERIEGIRVGTTGRKIHILHANSAFADPQGTPVASLVVHYSDGEQTQFDIRQGIEVLDWWAWPKAPTKGPTGDITVVAWTGNNPAARQQGAKIRLFDTVLENPSPEKEIVSADYVTALAGSAPFMVGLTIEH